MERPPTCEDEKHRDFELLKQAQLKREASKKGIIKPPRIRGTNWAEAKT